MVKSNKNKTKTLSKKPQKGETNKTPTENTLAHFFNIIYIIIIIIYTFPCLGNSPRAKFPGITALKQ